MITVALCLSALVAQGIPPHIQQQPPIQRQSSDPVLESQLRAVLEPSDWKERHERERLLLEVSTRPPQHWVPIVTAFLRDEVKRTDGKGYRDTSQEMHLLTTLRRLQGRADPLTVEATLLSEGPYAFPELPIVGVRLLHTDGETERFPFQIGGDYRSGRLARWNLELHDAEGKTHQGVDDWSAMTGGGLSTTRRVGPGFIWGVKFPDDMAAILAQREGEPVPETVYRPVSLGLADYCRPTRLGRFTVTTAYHGSVTIADLDSYDDRIVHRSQPIAFEWKVRTIHITDDDERRIQARIDDLFSLEEVTITRFHLPAYRGSNAADAHPLARLFTEEWKAVPLLIDALDASESGADRAHLIAALFSLTGLESPLGFKGAGAMGKYAVHGGRVPEGSGVFSTPMNGTGFGGRITEKAQRAFAKRWTSHRTYLKTERVR